MVAYRAIFVSRFLQVLQYRAAALAGFGTQCWWGGIKVMVLAAFFDRAASAAPAMTLAQAITYTWVAQGLLALLPWSGDPEVALAVRTGAVAYDRLRPVDAYALWFARSAGWIAARVLPRVALMAAFAAMVLPLAGFGAWSWQPPAGAAAGAAFAASALLALTLSTALVMLLNIAAAAALDARGINAFAVPWSSCCRATCCRWRCCPMAGSGHCCCSRWPVSPTSRCACTWGRPRACTRRRCWRCKGSGRRCWSAWGAC
jgi:ABC-2 type transport system permease protein